MLWRHLEDGSGQEGSVVTHLFDPLTPDITPRKGWQKKRGSRSQGPWEGGWIPKYSSYENAPHRLMKGTEPVTCMAGLWISITWREEGVGE